MSDVDTLLELSGPFTCKRAARRYRAHLEGLSEKRRAGLLADLKKKRGAWRPLTKTAADGGLNWWQRFTQRKQHG